MNIENISEIFFVNFAVQGRVIISVSLSLFLWGLL